MVWQEAFPPTGGPSFDAEAERERRLAAQARAGASWALTALVARYQPAVVRYLTRLCGNQAQAQRLAERIFQRMERRLHGPHGSDNLRLWLLRACTESGLDALRHPRAHGGQRLGASAIAGLLTEQTSAEKPGLLRGRQLRERKPASPVNKQAHPLIWFNDQPPAGPANDGADTSADTMNGHVDQTLDHLDPRDALRHRLVRVTLAELPFGDAQCLALHLVAGLNQAEVAKALGITNSAARRRIVHGLALFSDRYSRAVQSLGLPVELGFGDAIPRAPVESEAPSAPTPEPVIISSTASEASEAVASAAGEDTLVSVNGGAERVRDSLSGVSYLAEDSDEMPAVRAERAPVRRDTPPLASEVEQPVGAEGGAEVEPREPLVVEQDSAPVSGGLITRVASDAIIGPIVDALPVEPTKPEASGSFGIAGPRSTPLAYELNSQDSPDASGMRMRWLDESGMMTPLSFEALAIPTGGPAFEPAADTPLSFEATAALSSADLRAATQPPEDGAPLGFELAPTSDAESADVGLAHEAVEPVAEPHPANGAHDDAPLALVAERPAAPVIVPVVTSSFDAHDEANDAEAVAFAPPARQWVISRSLEDLWDELPSDSDL